MEEEGDGRVEGGETAVVTRETAEVEDAREAAGEVEGQDGKGDGEVHAGGGEVVQHRGSGLISMLHGVLARIVGVRGERRGL